MATFNAKLQSDIIERELRENYLKPLTLDEAGSWVPAVATAVHFTATTGEEQTIKATVVARAISPLLARIAELEAELEISEQQNYNERSF